jgi:hypothetical protein
MLVVDAPAIFSVLWRAVRSLPGKPFAFCRAPRALGAICALPPDAARARQVRGAIDDKTRRKIHFAKGATARAEAARALFADAARAAWLAQHMLDVRDRAAVKAAWAQPHPFPPGVAPYAPGL